MALRDHQPIVLEAFNGLWDRGDDDSVPIDHFSDCENIQFYHSGFRTRDGLNTYRAIGNVVRLYNYVMQTGESLLILNDRGEIFHSINETTTYGPILTISDMEDFGFTTFGGRAYITPFKGFLDPVGVSRAKGLQNEFVYVYKGDGTAARKAAGFPPTDGSMKPMVAFNSETDGLFDKGIHIIGVALVEGATQGPVGPEVFPVVNSPGGKEIQLIHIPTGQPATTARKIVATKAIDPKDYDPSAAPSFFEVATISNNTTTSIAISLNDIGMVTSYVPGAAPTPGNASLKFENTTTEGFCDPGLHIIAVVYETDTGFLTAPGPENFAVQSMVDTKRAVKISNIPVSPESFVTKRHLVSTKRIQDYNGDQKGYQFFFIPEGNIDNNTDTTKTVSYYDSDLLDDASHLIDNFSEIPAGVRLTTYHNRLVLTTEFDNISLVRVSADGEPEAINQVDGLVTIPLDGKPITTAQEFRDILYVFKQTRTLGVVDNGDEPAGWSVGYIDQGIGSSVHGISTVLDSGGVNIDYLVIVDYSGLMLFNGSYARPELSWKIKDRWTALEKNDFNKIQIMNDSLVQVIYITLPDKKMLIADYDEGLNAKDIKWAPWRFNIETSSITLIETSKLIIGAQDIFTG